MKGRNKIIQIILLYIENPKDTTKELLELINKFNKVAGYKINMQKSAAFLYTNNEQYKKQNKKILLNDSTKKNKISRN